MDEKELDGTQKVAEKRKREVQSLRLLASAFLVIAFLFLITGGAFLYVSNIREKEKKISKVEPKGKILDIYKNYYGQGQGSYYSYDDEKGATAVKTEKVATVTCRTSDCTFWGYALGKRYIILSEDEQYHIYDYVADKFIETLPYTRLDENFGESSVLVEKGDQKAVFNLDTLQESIPLGSYDDLDNYIIYELGLPGGPQGAVLTKGISAKKDGQYLLLDYITGENILPDRYDKIVCYRNSGGATGDYCEGIKNEQKELFYYNLELNQVQKLDLVYDQIIYIERDCAVVLKQDKIVLVSLPTLQGLHQFDHNLKEEIQFALFRDEKKDVVIVVGKGNTKQGLQMCREYIYNFDTKTPSYVDDTVCGGIAKPVLYLYPEKETKVQITFAHPELLTTTYPKFENRWKVLAKPNGDLYDSEGKYYYGLYWEEKPSYWADFKQGFYVEKEEAISFLEEKLSYIGLSDRERNEFIMYWLPILEKNGKNLIYFELTEEREKVNKIYIDPKPDSLLRIVMHVKKVDQKIAIPEQKLTPFQRKGFVAVEWGGWNH